LFGLVLAHFSKALKDELKILFSKSLMDLKIFSIKTLNRFIKKMQGVTI